MSTFAKISDLTAAATLVGDEKFELVQGGANVAGTPEQVRDYITGDASALAAIAGASALTGAFVNISSGISNTVQITGEHMLTADNELDYSASFTDGMSAATITFSELPSNTVAILAYTRFRDSGVNPSMAWKRASGDTKQFIIGGYFADGGFNFVEGIYWMPTGGNSIHVTLVSADHSKIFNIIGYKTGD